MKSFLKAAFDISPFGIFLVAVVSVFKYLMLRYEIDENIKQPLMWFCIAAGLCYVVGWSVVGVIENQGLDYELWEKEAVPSRKKCLLVFLVKYARTIPAIIAFLLFVYLFAPTTMITVVALLVGIIVRNSIQYFRCRPVKQSGN